MATKGRRVLRLYWRWPEAETYVRPRFDEALVAWIDIPTRTVTHVQRLEGDERTDPTRSVRPHRSRKDVLVMHLDASPPRRPLRSAPSCERARVHVGFLDTASNRPCERTSPCTAFQRDVRPFVRRTSRRTRRRSAVLRERNGPRERPTPMRRYLRTSLRIHGFVAGQVHVHEVELDACLSSDAWETISRR
eukprot:scaffold346_cov347-Pavlova_lutheri.AAC.20